jgi:hypothetical protein
MFCGDDHVYVALQLVTIPHCVCSVAATLLLVKDMRIASIIGDGCSMVSIYMVLICKVA